MNKNSSIWISLLFVLLLAGCGSSDESQEIVTIYGKWGLEKIDRSWGHVVEIPQDAVECTISDVGTIQLEKKVDVDIAPLPESGTYSFKVESDYELSIDGHAFMYQLSSGKLYIDNHFDSDGTMFVFYRLKS